METFVLAKSRPLQWRPGKQSSSYGRIRLHECFNQDDEKRMHSNSRLHYLKSFTRRKITKILPILTVATLPRSPLGGSRVGVFQERWQHTSNFSPFVFFFASNGSDSSTDCAFGAFGKTHVTRWRQFAGARMWTQGQGRSRGGRNPLEKCVWV